MTDDNFKKEYHARIHRNIEKHGCHVTHVMEDDDGPSFTYSTGIEKLTGRPEVLVSGLEKDTAHFLVNEYNYRIKDGEVFEAGKFYDEFLNGFQVTFREIDKKHYDDYLCCCQWYYKSDDFKALHMIWPSMEGVWPWEKKADKEYRYFLPKLYKG